MNKPAQDVVKHVSSAGVAWIQSADGKATALFGILGVVLPLTVSNFQEMPFKELEYLQAAFIWLVVLALLCCLRALLPSLDREKWLKDGVPSEEWDQHLDSSVVYFGSISEMTWLDFRAHLEESEELDAILQQDKVEQAYIVARIAHFKMVCVRMATFLSAFAVVTLAILYHLGGLG